MSKQEGIRDKRNRIRERIEAVIDRDYMRDECLVPNEVVFFVLDILNSEDVVIKVAVPQVTGDSAKMCYYEELVAVEPLIKEGE